MYLFKSRFLRALSIVSVTFVIVVAVLWFARAPLLTTFTNIWVVDEEAIHADAVVVLGGGANTRTFAAAEFYKQGLVKKVLIPDVLLEPTEKMGLVKSHTQVCKEVVLERGVSESAIELFGTQVSSTWEEAQAIKEWAEVNNANSILIPTEFPMTRRINWVMDKVLRKSEFVTHVIPIDGLKYERSSWWSNEYGLIDFQNEIIKYALYRFKY